MHSSYSRTVGARRFSTAPSAHDMGCLVSYLAFMPPPRGRRELQELRERGDLHWLRTTAGECLPALYILSSRFAGGGSAKRARARFTVLASHGNAEDLASVADTYEVYTPCPGSCLV